MSAPEQETPIPSTPPEERPAPPSGLLGQPWSGLAGLAIVALAAALLGLVVGAQNALEVIGPWSTFALPVLAAAALWWQGWPTAGLPRAAAGAVITVLIIGAGLVLTGLGQLVVGDAAFGHLLGTGTDTAQGYLTSFPWTVPLAAFVFVVMLQLTFVCRKWPFAKLPPVGAGFAAIATSWVLGTLGYLLLANWDSIPAPVRETLGLHNPGGPVDALTLIAVLLCIVIWQLVVFFLLDGYPVAQIRSQTPSSGPYLVVANATTIGLGIATWFVLHNGLGRSVEQVSATAGVIVAGTLVAGLLFEGWPSRLIAGPALRRLGLLATAAVVATVLGVGLRALALAVDDWTRAPALLWVGVAGLNFIGAVIIMHVVLYRRWPLPSQP